MTGGAKLKNGRAFAPTSSISVKKGPDNEVNTPQLLVYGFLNYLETPGNN